MPTIIEKNPDIERDRMAGRLPLRARRKVERWREAEHEGLALAQSDGERLIELQGEKAQAAFELDALERADADGKLFVEKRMPDEKVPGGFITLRERDTARLDAARAAVARAQDQIDRMRERQSQRERTPLHSVEEYLRTIGNTELVAHDGPTAKLAKGETWPVAVERVRGSITDLRDEAAATKLAPIPSAEAKKRARAEIERLASAGRPGTLALLERAGSIRWPVIPLQNVELTTAFIPQLHDGLAFNCWLHKDRMIKLMDEIVDEEADDEHALNDEQRASRLKQISSEILALERTEEQLIEQAEAKGVSIVRRGDADPRAILNLASSLPTPARHR